MTLIRTFLPIILGGTIILTILMLPVYFIRKKKNPDNKRNTIKIDCVVICGCINLCTIAGVGVDYYVFSGFVQLVR